MNILPTLSVITWIMMMMNGYIKAYENNRLADADIVFKAHESSMVQIPVYDTVHQLTVCFWLTLDSMPWPLDSLVFLNYSTHEEHDEVTVEYRQTDIQFAVGAHTVLRSNSFPQLDDGKWKFLCVQWENKNGMTSLYINGNMVANETNMQKHYEVANGDVRLGLGYSTARDLRGRMTCVNLWDALLSAQTILQLYNGYGCGSHLNALLIDWGKISEELREKGSPLLLTPSRLTNEQVIATTTCTKPQLLHGHLVPNTALIGHLISTREVVSELHCQDQCLRAQACVAYNIEQQATARRKTCQLIGDVTGVNEDNFGFGRIFNRNSIHKALLAPCPETKEETVPNIPRTYH